MLSSTAEQQAIIQAVKASQENLLIAAFAGSGKTLPDQIAHSSLLLRRLTKP